MPALRDIGTIDGWKSCDDPQRMLLEVLLTPQATTPSGRLLRLFGFALYEAWHRRGHEHDPEGHARRVAADLAWIDEERHRGHRDEWNLRSLAPDMFAPAAILDYTTAGIRPVRWQTTAGRDGNRRRVPGAEAAAILRDLVPDPRAPLWGWTQKPQPWTISGGRFHSRHLPLAWRSPDVLGVAAEVYDERRFADLPVLADALEDAGCAEEGILTHLRDPAPHVRGCWALELFARSRP